MKDAIGQDLFVGDVVTIPSSTGIQLAVIKELLETRSAVQVLKPQVHIPYGRAGEIPQFTLEIKNKRVGIKFVTKVSQEAVSRIKVQWAPTWRSYNIAPEITAASAEAQLRIFNWLLVNYHLPKVKVPPEMKNV